MVKLFRKYLIIFFISYLSVNYAFSTDVNSELNYYKKINLPYSSNELIKCVYQYLSQMIILKLKVLPLASLNV